MIKNEPHGDYLENLGKEYDRKPGIRKIKKYGKQALGYGSRKLSRWTDNIKNLEDQKHTQAMTQARTDLARKEGFPAPAPPTSVGPAPAPPTSVGPAPAPPTSVGPAPAPASDEETQKPYISSYKGVFEVLDKHDNVIFTTRNKREAYKWYREYMKTFRAGDENI